MTGQIETEGFFLKSQILLFIPFTNFRQSGRVDTGLVVATIAKQPHLGVVALFLNPLAIFKRTFDGCHQLGSFGSGHIEGAAFNQALNNPFVYLFQINPFAKIEERFKAFFPAAGDNGFDGAFTDIFDGHQPVADL